ncbi:MULTISPECIES: hypothetical protein [Acinetobacter]|uniref:Uncharacterized protein n=1 Tax=Acinetobacter haemolyticus TaxID=29430 RepID=A0A857IN27_ACIHA|nr:MULTISPECIES: hypothetical protein [Acinetobacter]AVZ86501.1 hypothetical protein CDG55_12610 [Acinetobacter sp. WCHA45]EXE98991.1 helix-turn-helix domain protein [Acinetobacter sp. 259052]KRJ11726.1 hypothetical protein APC77_10405 [Acinetobacter nosocomialis]MBR7697783.1 hypothetical protein [Acinetobacter nosocomialis]OUR08078.1 hypothetical protein B4R78_07925 [Acinetobacter nosocomialis]
MEDRFLLFLLAHEFSPITLSPTARWLLLQIIQMYGGQEFCLTTAMTAKEFVFHEKKLQTTLNELQEHQTIIQRTDDKSGKAFVKLDIEMFSVRGSLKTTSHFDIERWFTKLMNHDLPLKALFFHLVDTRLHDFYVHHLQHVKPILSGKIDFKTALVLMVLIRHSNQFGITNKCGIHKLKHKTGLSKDAIFRCIKKLKQQGIVRTRVDGTQSSAIVRVSNPFFVLNLSHEIWGDKARYGCFFIIKYPQPHSFEVQKIGRLIQLFEKYKTDIKTDHHIAFASLIKKIPTQLSDHLCHRAIPKNDDQPKLSQEDLVSNLLNLYVAINEDVWLKEFVSYVETETQSLQLNGDLSSCALFQCYLEQWCTELSYVKNRYERLLVGLEFLDSESIQKLESTLRLNSFLSLLDSDRNKSVDGKELKNLFHHIWLVGLLITLIANNQLYPFLVFQDNLKNLKPYSILPRSSQQQNYSCIFMVDPTLQANQFFLLDNTNDVQFESQKQTIKERILSFDNSPSLQQLKDFGLLPKESMSIDHLVFIEKSSVTLA